MEDTIDKILDHKTIGLVILSIAMLSGSAFGLGSYYIAEETNMLENKPDPIQSPIEPDNQGIEQCKQEVENLGEDREAPVACTTVIAKLSCPHADYNYTASNGCEAGELRDKGWE